MVCVRISRMGTTTLQTEDGDWSGDYRGPLLDGWYMCMNGRTVSASVYIWHFMYTSVCIAL